MSPADANLKTWLNTLCTQNAAISSLDIGKLWLIILNATSILYSEKTYNTD